jgi:predicted secreted protein
MQTLRPHQAPRATVAEGEVFAVELPSRPTTGYRWDAACEGGLTLLTRESVPASAAVGVSALTRFVLRADAPGPRAIRFTYRRPWEPLEVESVILTIDVAVP